MEKTDYEKILDFNLIGLDDDDQVDSQLVEEMEKTKLAFKSFREAASEKYKICRNKYLYGDYTESEFQQELLKHDTVEEGLKHIPGRMSEEELQKALYALIDTVINQLEKLKKTAEKKMLYKKDVKNIKQNLLGLLLNLFSSPKDFKKFQEAVLVLENKKIVPVDSMESLAQSSSMGRWMD